MVIVLIIIGFSLSDKDTQQVSDYSIKIGAVLSLTGPAAVDSLHIQRGLELAKEDLQAQGVNVEIKYEDDQTDSKAAISALHKLIETYKPDAFVGLVWSFLIDSGGPIVDKAHIPLFSPSGTSAVVGIRSPYVFHGAVKNDHKVEPLARWFIDNDIESIAIVVDSGAWGTTHEEVYKKAAQNVDVDVVLSDRIVYTTESDVLPVTVTKIKSTGADAVLWAGSHVGATILIQKMQQQKVGIPVIGNNEIDDVINRELVELEESDVTLYAFKNPTNNDFDNKHKAKYGEKAGIHADSAYDGLMLLVEAIQNTDGTGEAISSYLQNQISYEGFSKTYSFDENGDVEGGEWLLEQIL